MVFPRPAGCLAGGRRPGVVRAVRGSAAGGKAARVVALDGRERVHRRNHERYRLDGAGRHRRLPSVRRGRYRDASHRGRDHAVPVAAVAGRHPLCDEPGGGERHGDGRGVGAGLELHGRSLGEAGGRDEKADLADARSDRRQHGPADPDAGAVRYPRHLSEYRRRRRCGALVPARGHPGRETARCGAFHAGHGRESHFFRRFLLGP